MRGESRITSNSLGGGDAEDAGEAKLVLSSGIVGLQTRRLYRSATYHAAAELCGSGWFFMRHDCFG